MLILRLEPDDLPRRTLREMLEANHEGLERDCDGRIRVMESGSLYATTVDKDELVIGNTIYNCLLMDGYNGDNQIDGEEGQIVLYDLMTYDFGEVIPFTEVKRRAEALEAWAAEICSKHKISKWTVEVSANYR